MYVGTFFMGEGFILDHETADAMIMANPKLSEVIFPVINGSELNSHPEQQPGRRIINFFDWPLSKAEIYEEAIEHLRLTVKPYRESKPDPGKWWQHWRPRLELYSKIRGLSRCFIAARTTKYLSFSAASPEIIFTDATYVFATDRWEHYALIQSTSHELWARKYSGALKQDLRYSPSDCFETFPFPEGLWQITDTTLATIGERYHEYRRDLMLCLWLGLTDIYNLFHNRDLTHAIVTKISGKQFEAEAGYQGILELRKLHRELDEAVLAAYSWTDLNLGHNFYEVETLPVNNRVRYTISPDARKELLKRLLALNHQRAAEEKAKAPMKAVKVAKRARKPKTDDMHGSLFDLPQPTLPQDFVVKPTSIFDPNLLPDGSWTRPMVDQSAEIGAILAAVLKAVGGPTPARQVRLTALLASEPRLLTPILAGSEVKVWKRLIGQEAEPHAGVVTPLVPRADRTWGSSVQLLRSSGLLVEDIAAGTWAPGTGLDVIETVGWPEGRVHMVLNILSQRGDEKVIQQLPVEIQRWLDAKAA